MLREKKFVPERHWHPRSERAGNQEAASDVFPDREPIGDEVVTDCRPTFRGEDFLKDCAAADRHVHFGVAFHLAMQTFFSLLSRLLHHLRLQEQPKKNDKDHHHQRAAGELRERELPTDQNGHDDA